MVHVDHGSRGKDEYDDDKDGVEEDGGPERRENGGPECRVERTAGSTSSNATPTCDETRLTADFRLPICGMEARPNRDESDFSQVRPEDYVERAHRA